MPEKVVARFEENARAFCDVKAAPGTRGISTASREVDLFKIISKDIYTYFLIRIKTRSSACSIISFKRVFI